MKKVGDKYLNRMFKSNTRRNQTPRLMPYIVELYNIRRISWISGKKVV